MNNHQPYRQFCAQTPGVPVYMQPWYLDAVCADGYWDAAVVEKAGQIVAVMPYFLKQTWGVRRVVMPLLCRQMGPYLMPAYRQSRHETSLLKSLIAQLPRMASFSQDFPYEADNWLPFYWAGFRQTTRYSFVLPLAEEETLWKGLDADYRNNKIPRARQTVEVRTGEDLDLFCRIHDLSYRRQSIRPPVSFDYLKKLDDALKVHGSRAILYAADMASGQVCSVAYLIWDAGRAYYLMAGDDPAFRQSGSGVYIAWEAIRFAKNHTDCAEFDFAGSMAPGIARVRRQLGAQPRPYFRVEKEWNAPLRWYNLWRS